MTLAILLPAQLLDCLAVLTAFLLGRVAIPITSAKLALSVAAPTSIVTAVITTTVITTTVITTMLSIVMVAAAFIRRVVLVIIVRILLLALALSFGAVIKIFAEDICCAATPF